jgi:hypothetical protein
MALVLASTLPAFADSWATPRPRVFASQGGLYGFKVLKPVFGRTAVGLLFTLDQDGQETKIWETELVNVPHRVLVPDGGKRVVTIDTYGRLGYDHSLVVYDEHGKVLADYTLEDLLTDLESQFFVTQSVSSRYWARQATFTFNSDATQLVIGFRRENVSDFDIKALKEQLNSLTDEIARDYLQQAIEEFEALPEGPTREIAIDLESGEIVTEQP